MKAKEMFEKLGYVETTKKDHTIEYSQCLEDEHFGFVNRRTFTFYKRQKQVVITSFYSKFEDGIILESNELQAINKQVEELHWNDTTVNIDVKLDGKKVISIEVDDFGNYNLNNEGWTNRHIKSIVTKEAFERMEYRIGE